MIFSFPIVTKFNADTDPHALNVRLDFRVERVLLGIGVLGDKGIDLLAEAGDAVRRGHPQVAGLSIVGLHLRVRHTRSLLRARKAQEGDYHDEKRKYQRMAQQGVVRKLAPPQPVLGKFRPEALMSVCLVSLF